MEITIPDSLVKAIEQHIDLVQFHEHDISIKSRTIYIGEIDPELGIEAYMANICVKNVLKLEEYNHDPITIILNSIGGDWYHGMAMYNKIANSPCHIKMIVYGHAMSMGSIILQGADERVMAKHAVMMVHNGTEGFLGNAKDFQSYAKHAETQLEEMYKIYTEKTGLTRKKMIDICSTDQYYTATEAVKMGLADYVL